MKGFERVAEKVTIKALGIPCGIAKGVVRGLAVTDEVQFNGAVRKRSEKALADLKAFWND